MMVAWFGTALILFLLLHVRAPSSLVASMNWASIGPFPDQFDELAPGAETCKVTLILIKLGRGHGMLSKSTCGRAWQP